jgi:putative DNA primase/helicase
MKKSGAIPNDVARLAGARFVALNETGEGQTFNEPLLKDLTGGDTLTARFLFKEFFDFTPQCKLWIRGNHQPQIKGTDDGVWRRFRIVPFGVQIPEHECDPVLLEKLKGELPGVLRWAVDGCIKWQATGLKAPPSVVEAVTQYRKESDPVGQFLEEACVLHPDGVVPATPLYQAYRAWATACGEQKMSQTLFGRSLRSRGFKKAKVSVNVYHGIALKGQLG